MKLILLISLILLGCAEPPLKDTGRFEGSGIRAEAPIGYTDTCKQHPEQEFCKL